MSKYPCTLNYANTYVDIRYIQARDNYSCYRCASPADHVLKLDPDQAWSASNVVLVCSNESECALRGPATALAAPGLPMAVVPGRLVVVASCMFSEKTTTTKSLLNKYSRTVGKHIWIKPNIDSRGKGITTHNKEEIDAKIISADRPDRHLEEISKYDVIAFDEVQFYSPRILYVIHQLLKLGKLVIANGLKLDYKRNIFGVVHYLLAEADDIISPKSICNRCNKIDVATRTKKLSENGPSVEVGGDDKYYAVCPECDAKNL